MFRFASPYFFLLLLFIPAALYHRHKVRVKPAIGTSSLWTASRIKSSIGFRVNRILPFLKYLVLILLVLALARPQSGTRQTTILSEGINIILAVDLSESMKALDFKLKGKIVNRLEAVKSVVREFVSKREGDRIGLVVFGTNAYTQLPLTRDYGTISSILDRVEIGAAGKRTAIGDAIGISIKRLEDVKSKSSIIILLTDGRSNAGELNPGLSAEIAAQKNIKVYTIGVGSKGRVPMPVDHPIFGRQYERVRVDMDEGLLKKIARDTGGLYFRAEDTGGLKRVYGTIDQLEKNKIKMKTYDEYHELYHYLLWPAMGMIVLWVFLSNTRFLRLP